MFLEFLLMCQPARDVAVEFCELQKHAKSLSYNYNLTVFEEQPLEPGFDSFCLRATPELLLLCEVFGKNPGASEAERSLVVLILRMFVAEPRLRMTSQNCVEQLEVIMQQFVSVSNLSSLSS
jgi:hypothetical protein